MLLYVHVIQRKKWLFSVVYTHMPMSTHRRHLSSVYQLSYLFREEKKWKKKKRWKEIQLTVIGIVSIIELLST